MAELPKNPPGSPKTPPESPKNPPGSLPPLRGSPPGPLTVRCNAKVNLYLKVLARRPDGFHDIETVFHSIALHDTLTLRPTSGAMTLSCDAGIVPTGPENLALKAAAVVLEGTPHGVDIHLAKRIPVGAGLGGGSADAAGTLIGLNSLFGLGRSAAELQAMAEGLGADVKFLLEGGCAEGRGRGDELRPIPAMPALPILLALPGLNVSTAWAYDSLKMRLTSQEHGFKMITSALDRGDIACVFDLLSNDFEGLIFDNYPSVGRIKEDLLGCGAKAALMSGTGPVVYGIFETEAGVAACAERLARGGIDTVRTYLTEQSVTVLP
jgi:4-diphosphocytidyl-2-C-methyl-D-erythritol kinase